MVKGDMTTPEDCSAATGTSPKFCSLYCLSSDSSFCYQTCYQEVRLTQKAKAKELALEENFSYKTRENLPGVIFVLVTLSPFPSLTYFPEPLSFSPLSHFVGNMLFLYSMTVKSLP